MSAFSVDERNTPIYECDLVTETGAALGSSLLTSATLTVKDAVTGDVINGRDAQDVLNANNVSISPLGHLTWEIQEADTTLVRSDVEQATHRAVFDFEWGSGKRKTHQVDVVVKNVPWIG